MFRSLTILFLIISSSNHVWAQELSFKHYTVNDGLPSSEVYSVTQDSKGFIWLGTDRGVAQFDGYKFLTFTTANGLSDNTVFKILSDPKDSSILWFRTFNAKPCILSSGKFKKVNGSIPYQKHIGFFIDSNSNIIQGTNKGPVVVTNNNKDTLFIDAKRKETDSIYVYISEYGSTNRFHIQAIGNNSYKGKKKSNLLTIVYTDQFKKTYKKSVGVIPDHHMNNNPFPFSAERWDSSSFLITVGHYFIYFNPKKQVKFCPFNYDLGPIYIDQSKNIWIGGIKGLTFIASSQIKKWVQNTSKEISTTTYLSGKIITDILQDKEGGYWFTSLEDGVYYIPSLMIQSISTNSTHQSNKVLCLGSAPNNKQKVKVIFGMQDGHIYGTDGSRTQKMFSDLRRTDKSFPLAFLTCGNNVWMGCSNSYGLLNLTTNKRYAVPFIKEFYKESDSVFYALHTNMIWKVVQKKNSISMNKIVDRGSLNFSSVCSLDGKLWVGSIDGLYTFEKNRLTFQGKKNKLFMERITDIQRSSDDRLWIATRGAGLLIKSKDGITQLTETNGLISNLCNYIFICNDSSVWVATNKGLSIIYYHGNNYRIRNINSADGLISNEISQITQTGDTIWVATNKGVSFFNTHSITSSVKQTPIRLTSIAINGKDTNQYARYDLSYNENSIIVSYVGLSYKNAGRVKYRYQLSGIDTSWNYSALTSLQYNFLSPGKYVLTVNPQNLDGSWSSAKLGISFTIHSPYWETWWFRVSLIVLSASTIYTVITIRNNNRRAFEKLSNDLNKSKHQALSAQMDPHFIFNTLNSIHNYILSEDKRFASKYLVRFSSLMRKMLDHSQRNYITLDEELSALKIYLELEKLRFKNKFDFSIILNVEGSTKTLMVPTMILQPFIENAILHGLVPSNKEGLLELEFHLSKDDLICCIRDNGIGIDTSIAQKTEEDRKDPEHHSVGMSITEKRLELINLLYNSHMKLRIRQIDKDRGGTSVEICFPQDIAFD